MRTAHSNYLEYKSISEFPSGDLLQDRVLVEPERHTIIDLIDSPNSKATKGVVLRVGRGAFNKKGVRIPLDVKVGDRIAFRPHGVVEVFLKGSKNLIVRENQISGVYE